MNSNDKNTTARLIVGLLLIGFGALFLMDNYGLIDFSLPYYLFRWQFIIVGIGIYILVTTKNKTAGIILISIGIFTLYPQFWPLVLVGLGAYIILKRNRSKNFLGSSENYSGIGDSNFDADNTGESMGSDKAIQDSIDDLSIFGGGTKNFISKNFRGGKLTALFGGSDIHLENCHLAHGQNELDIFAMFGGYTIFVPQDWNVIVDVIPLFGGFSDKRMKDPNRVYEEDKVLVIKGLVLFGGGELKF
ncbi:MAG: DUF5668 domain-containing protein [Melioribacteraceae bacterium]|nr:DUF5668 domain-containing protein [Melioribacteraceae bacterium]